MPDNEQQSNKYILPNNGQGWKTGNVITADRMNEMGSALKFTSEEIDNAVNGTIYEHENNDILARKLDGLVKYFTSPVQKNTNLTYTRFYAEKITDDDEKIIVPTLDEYNTFTENTNNNYNTFTENINNNYNLFKQNFVQPYSKDKAYAKGDYIEYGEKIYKLLAPITAKTNANNNEDAWATIGDNDKQEVNVMQELNGLINVYNNESQLSQEKNKIWIKTQSNEVQVPTYEEFSNLKSAVTSEYDSESTYTAGNYVWHNGGLYRAKVDISVEEEWTSGHWMAIDIGSAINLTTQEICNDYDATATYAVGDYVRHNNNIYRCRVATLTGGETWTSGHWTKINNVLPELRTLINEIQNTLTFDNAPTTNSTNPVTSGGIKTAIDNAVLVAKTDGAIARWKSDEIPDERYENITYIEKLFSGESYDVLDNGSNPAPLIEKDYDVRFHNNPYSVHYKTNTTAEGYTNCWINMTDSFTLAGTQEIDVIAYIPDLTGITQITLAVMSTGMTKTITVENLTAGWNKLRFYLVGAGTVNYTASSTSIRIRTYHATGTNVDVYIGSIIQVKPDKGNLIIIQDTGYYTFYTDAYPTLKQMNVPVTWGINFDLDENDAVSRSHINQAELDLLAMDGLSEFSFRASGNIDFRNDTTPQPALEDTLKCIRLLQKNHIEPERIFRAVWPFNSSPYPELANLELDASVSYDGGSGVAVFPWNDRYNIPRCALGNQSEEWVDGYFDALKNQHCTVLMYLHGIGTGSGQTSSELFAYFVDKIEDSIEAGWLNCTTYNRLCNHYKRKF